nr:DUF664 domain-containing protein [Streptomyces sp. NRRL F-525]
MTTDTPQTLPDGRPIPAMTGAERPMLESWLGFHRATLEVKCAGLDDAQVRLAAAAPSSLTLLGLVQHLAEVERNWFQRVFGLDVPTVYGSEDGYALDPGRADGRRDGSQSAVGADSSGRGVRAAQRSRRHPPGKHRRRHRRLIQM